MKRKVIQNVFIYTFFIILILIFALIYSFLLHKGVVNSRYNNVVNTTFILGLILFLIFGLVVGNVKQSNGLMNGIIYAGVIFIFLLLLSFLGFDIGINFRGVIKIAAFMLACGIGGSMGVNLKKIV